MVPTAPSDRSGFVLVAVLGCLMLLGAVTFALVFASTLDAQAARGAQRAVIEREALEGALQLALAELELAAEPGSVTQLGPWEELGTDVTVQVSTVSDVPAGEPVAGALRLEARLPPPSRRQGSVMVVSLQPELKVTWRP